MNIIQKLRWTFYGRSKRVNAVIANFEQNRLHSRIELIDNYRKTRVSKASPSGNEAS